MNAYPRTSIGRRPDGTVGRLASLKLEQVHPQRDATLYMAGLVAFLLFLTLLAFLWPRPAVVQSPCIVVHHLDSGQGWKMYKQEVVPCP